MLKDSFIANLLRIIQHMQPKTSKQSGKKSNENLNNTDTLACKFPGLAIPNETVVNDPISEVMAELESFAPAYNSKYD
jgi:ATP-dependent RNA helicase DHX8/PRP22